MAHSRSRYLKDTLAKDIKWARVVSLLGMRQCGKTTLMKELVSSYATLDDETTLNRLNAGDWTLVDSATPTLGIDEAQLCPKLFPRVKLKTDQTNRTGLFLLTGSVRFLARDQIRESLTGRTSIAELLPMTLAESHGRPLFDLASTLVSQTPDRALKALSKRAWATSSDLQRYLEVGGMPGICFKRDASVQKQLWASHLETVLSRDLKLLIDTQLEFRKLLLLYREVARSCGAPLNRSAISRQIGVSAPTVKKLLQQFESLFLIRAVGAGYYCEDLGLSAHAAGGSQIFHEGETLRRFVFAEIFAQLTYLYRGGFQLGNYSTRGGAHVPFVANIDGKATLAIVTDPGEGASDSSLQSLTSFKKRNRTKDKMIPVVVHQGKTGYVSGTGTLCIPWTWIA